MLDIECELEIMYFPHHAIDISHFDYQSRVVLSLWDAILNFRRDPTLTQGFGDWSSMLEELDPFRDGRAAERLGNYLKWLLDALRDGGKRETVLADVADRYAAQWGHDKITKVCPSTSVGRSKGMDSSNYSEAISSTSNFTA